MSLPLTAAQENELCLQMLSLEYAESLFQLIDSNRTYLSQWLNWLDLTQSIDDTVRFIKISMEQANKGIGAQYLILTQQQPCGIVSFNRIENTNRIGYIGYWLAAPYTGKGIMTSAVARLLELGFEQLQLNKIEIRCAQENRKSQAIPERLGFHFDAILRQNEYLHGRFVDHRVYSLLKSEFRQKQ